MVLYQLRVRNYNNSSQIMWLTNWNNGDYLSCFLLPISYIDQGKNPQLYTKDCMEKALLKNETVKGKIDAFKVRWTAHLWYALV